MAFLLQGLRKFAGRPKRKYSQGREKSNHIANEVTARFEPFICIKMYSHSECHEVRLDLVTYHPFDCQYWVVIGQ